MTACPEHPDTELRAEYGPEGWSGFCLKCVKHYKFCGKNYGTWACMKLKNHQGEEHAHYRPGGRTTTWGPVP